VSHDTLDLESMAQAFVHMLPGSGDVLLHSFRAGDEAILRSRSVFAMQCHPVDNANLRSVETGGLVVRRNLDRRPLPFSPDLFAGAWLRFEETPNNDELQESLRVVVPGGLVIVIVPAVVNATAWLSQFQAEREENFRILGASQLEGPDGAQAILLIRSASTNKVARQTNCKFCPPLRFVTNHNANLPGAAAVLWGDDDFLVIPDIAPLDRGHLLLVSTQHYLSMGAILKSSHVILEEHVSRINRITELAFGKPAIFVEHGATQSHEAGACIDHAHWHCLPDNGTIMAKIERLGMHGEQGPLVMATDWYNKERPYFLVRRGQEHFFYSAAQLPCQFLRFIAANNAMYHNPRWQHVLSLSSNLELYFETLIRTLPAADTTLHATSRSTGTPRTGEANNVQ